MYLELYQAGTNDFSRSGIILADAYNVLIKKRINSAFSLSFNMPRHSLRWSYVKRESIIKAEGQLYIVKIINDGANEGMPFAKVEARHIWWELCELKHMPSAFFIGENVSHILGNVFSGISYNSNVVRQMTAAEVTALGLTPVTSRTDIDMSKTNPLAVIAKIINHVSGEIYVDNFKFALVKQLGRETRLHFSFDKNLKSVDRIDETTKLVTRLTPYGKESRDITSINGGIHYIDSPLINNYSKIYEGFIEFNDIEDIQELRERAMWEFSPENHSRIDVPRVSYRCSVIDLWKLPDFGNKESFDIGDFVTVYDNTLGFDNRVRVVEYDFYPYEPQSGTVTLGNPAKTIFEMLAQSVNFEEYYYQAEVPEPNLTEISESITENVVNNVSESIDNTVNNVFETSVLSAETAMILNLWARYLMVEFLETNFDALDIRLPAPKNNLRHFVRIHGIKIEHIEAVLDPEETEDYKNPFGDQIYWSAISGNQAYKFFTITDPLKTHKPVIPDDATQEEIEELREELREKFRVKVRKTLTELVKKSESFDDIRNADGTATIAPRQTWGTGDENGFGKGFVYKNADGFYFTYTLRRTLGDLPAGAEIGLKIDDEGIWHFDIDSKDWKLISGGGHKIVDGDNVEFPKREILKFNNSVIVDDEETNTTIVTPMVRIWKHLHIADNYFTVTWDNDEQDNYLLEFYPDGRISAIISLERRWTFSYE